MGMTRTILCGLALFAAMSATQADALLIDDFTEGAGGGPAGTDVFVTPGPGTSTGSTTAGPFASVIGGKRDTTVTNTSPGLGLTDWFIKSGTGLPPMTPVMAYESGTGVTGSAELLYDAGGLGLGGVDFTDLGMNNAFNVGINFADAPTSLFITVDDGGGPVSGGPFPLPFGIFGGAPVAIPIPFADFPGVDFTMIDSVEFVIDAPIGGTDLEFLFLETTLIPEPSTIALALLGLLGLACFAPRRRS